MQYTTYVSGFSVLKDLLIQKHGIDRGREKIRLYFSVFEDSLIMHDYSDHQKTLTISLDLSQKDIAPFLKGSARLLCEEALKHEEPDKFLNEGFTLYGFFRF
jgi:hypothetical protein